MGEQGAIGAFPNIKQGRKDKGQNLITGANPIQGKIHFAQTMTGKQNILDMINSAAASSDTASLHVSSEMYMKAMDHEM